MRRIVAAVSALSLTGLLLTQSGRARAVGVAHALRRIADRPEAQETAGVLHAQLAALAKRLRPGARRRPSD